jgi:hypothetical protein
MVFFFSVVIGISISLSRKYLTNIPTSEVLYTSYLICLIWNFIMLRGGYLHAYIEDNNLNKEAKIAGITSFMSVIFLIIAIRSIDYETPGFIYLLAWIVNFLFEK